MEKLLYPVWKRSNQSADDFRDHLLRTLGPLLLELPIRGLRIAVVDSETAAGAPLRQVNCRPAIDGMISVWLDTAWSRQDVEHTIEGNVLRTAGYLATESEPLECAAPVGERTPGMSQVVFLQRPPRVPREQWLEVWLGSHTDVAIETQATFGYRQNVIARPLTYAAPPFDAIVEENFPAAAMTSQHAFYGVDSDEALAQKQASMMESCVRFIDFDKLDVLICSEYVLKPRA